MSDEADLANDRAEQDLAALLRRRLPAGPAATGACLWCETVVPFAVRWCSPECRDDWELHAPS